MLRLSEHDTVAKCVCMQPAALACGAGCALAHWQALQRFFQLDFFYFYAAQDLVNNFSITLHILQHVLHRRVRRKVLSAGRELIFDQKQH